MSDAVIAPDAIQLVEIAKKQFDVKTKPVVYENLQPYIEANGTLEYYKGLPGNKIEFRFKTQSADGQYNAEFYCHVNQETTGEDRQAMLNCIQSAHDWKIAQDTTGAKVPV